MEKALILETSFLFDLEREQHRARRAAGKRSAVKRAAGPAQRFLRARPGEHLYITITTAGELAAGAGADERSRWEALIRPFAILGVDLDVCWNYSRAYHYLADHGMLIGANDLWIAAIAVTNDLPLVTRDTRHFSRVPGLRAIGYNAE